MPIPVWADIEETQKGYFTIVDRHLGGPFKSTWASLDRLFRQDPATYGPADVLRVLRPEGGIITPSVVGGWTSGALRHIEDLGQDVAEHWRVSAARISEVLEGNTSFGVYIPCGHANMVPLARASAVYADAVLFEDPLARIPDAVNSRRQDFTVLPRGMRATWTNAVERSNFITAGVAFFDLWQLLQIRNWFDSKRTPLPAVVIPPLGRKIRTGGAEDDPLVQKVVLSQMSDVAGTAFSSEEELVRLSASGGVQWAKIASVHPILRTMLGLEERASPTESDVALAVGYAMVSIGIPESELPKPDALATNTAFMAKSLFTMLARTTARQIGGLWDSSRLSADLMIRDRDWALQEWVAIHLSGGTIPPTSIATCGPATLAVQRPELGFLGLLTDDELRAIREDEGVDSMRRMLVSERSACRAAMATSRSDATENSKRFLTYLDEHQEKLAEARRKAAQGLASRATRTARTERAELAVPPLFLTLSLLIPAPWSLIVSGLGVLIGGKSIKDIIDSARQGAAEDRQEAAVLSQCPSSICLRARGRAASA